MSIIAEVTQKLGVNREAVLRVAREGGTSSRDWDIAIAIEKAGGRSAVDTMWAARSRGPQTEDPAPANAQAEYVEDVTVYPEDTSPESPNRVAPDHLSDTTEAPTEDEQLRTQAWAAIANITHATREVIDRMVARWTTTSAIYAGVAHIVRSSRHPRARKLHATYVTAA